MLTVLCAAALAAWLGVLLLPWQPHRVRERVEAVAARPSLGGVSVLIPARNEAEVIERTLGALARQGSELDVVVVDDESDDGTAELCERFARSAPARAGAHPISVHVVSGRPRPPGWSGKLWALQQGLEHVTRERLLLLDADIELEPGTIAALTGRAERSGAALVSVMATLRCRTFAERLLAPPFVFFFKLLYPFALAASTRHRTAAAAGGCMLVCTQVLHALGGFEPLRGALIDDCTLAKAIKRAGHRVWIGMSHSVRSLRAYSFGDFWRMVSRTAFTQLRYSTWRLLGTVAAMLVVFVAPVAAVVAAPFLPASVAVPAAALGAAALAAMSLAYLPVVRFYGLPAAWTLTLPLAAALFLGMTIDSALGCWRGVRARWKGRAYEVLD